MNFRERIIAITDLETTGDIPGVHEILEIGLVLCKPKTFEIVDTLNVKVKPLHLDTSIDRAMSRNGYNEKDWANAGTLKEAMEIYGPKVKEAVFYSYNVTFDWGFIIDAFKQTGVKNEMDYHHFDIMSMALQKFGEKMESASLDSVSKLVGIPTEPMPHNALNGAMQAYEVLKRL